MFHFSFKFASAFAIHEKSHETFQDYICMKCDQSFSSAVDLKEHAKVHEKKSNYCHECKKEFENLDLHMRQHSGEFSCYVCGEY